MLEKIIHYYKPYKLILLLVLIGSCFSALMELLFPYIVRQMLNVQIPQKNIDELLYWAGILLALYVVNFGLLFSINYYGHVMSSGIENDMRRDLFGHMEKMSFRFFDNARTGQLLNYGFANCSAYRDDHPPVLLPMAIKDGKTESVELMYDGQFSYVALRGENLENIHSKLQLDESLSPPFEAGTKAGRLIYYLDDTEIGEVPVVTKEGIQKAGFSDYLEKVYRNFMSICG